MSNKIVKMETANELISTVVSTRRDRLVLKHGEVNMSKENLGYRRKRYIKDIFTTFIDAQWRWTFTILTSAFLTSWTIFACFWYAMAVAGGDIEYYKKWLDAIDKSAFEMEFPRTPCVRHLYSFTSAFLFSIETQHTIGYGFRHVTEECFGGPFLLAAQSLIGVLIQAFCMGAIIAKLARPKKRAQNIIFSKNAVIYHRDGVPCLIFKIADMRKSYIVQAQVRARIIRQRTTKEGEYLDFCQDELTLKIDNCNDRLMLMWPTLVTHKIDEESPLYEFTSRDIANEHYEILVMLEGGVESTGLATQARTSYLPSEILWGHRFKSTISYNDKNGGYQANFELFNQTFKVDTPECSAKELKEGKSSKHEPRQNLLTPNGVNSSFINSS